MLMEYVHVVFDIGRYVRSLSWKYKSHLYFSFPAKDLMQAPPLLMIWFVLKSIAVEGPCIEIMWEQ